MRYSKIDGIVLKRRSIGEADRLLTIFTRQHGKIQVKAAGVRKISSKRASHIEPLNRISCTVYKGQGTPVLTEATSTESFSALKENLTHVGFAYHVCELVDSLCPENQENSYVFDLLETLLKNMCEEENAGRLIHAFEVELLKALGYYSEGSVDLTGAKASYFIESILERKLKTRQILPQLNS